MSKQMERIEFAFRDISEALKTGQFTRTELEGVKLFAEHVAGATDKVLARAALKGEQ